MPGLQGLLKKDLDGEPIPCLATGWQWNDDHTALTLTLRQGVKFHDGTDFNAASVKWGLDAIRTAKTPELTSVSSIDIIDDYTIRLTVSEFSNIILNDLASKGGQAAGISPTAVQTNGDEWAVTHLVGTGPFKQTEFTRAVGIKFEKFDDYWEDGKPYLDGIEFSFQTDPVTAKASFMAGEGDIFATIQPIDAAELAKTGKYEIAACSQAILGMVGDSANPDSPYSKIEVRQAVSYAIDNKSIADALGYGYQKETNQHAFPSNYMYNQNIAGYPYNPEKARELLAQAGYPDGFDTTLYYLNGQGWEQTFTAVQRYLDEVGIRAELQAVATGRNTELRTQGWENALYYYLPYMALGYPPSKTIQFYLSQGSNFYVSVLHPDDVEAQLSKGLTDIDHADVVKDMQELNRLVIDKYCTVNPLYETVNLAAIYPYVRDARIFNPWQEMWTPENAWLDK
jgi:ABC-type transport system substrate-binding protein